MENSADLDRIVLLEEPVDLDLDCFFKGDISTLSRTMDNLYHDIYFGPEIVVCLSCPLFIFKCIPEYFNQGSKLYEP